MRQRINTSAFSADSCALVMAPGQGDASTASSLETSWITEDMAKFLAKLQESGSIYFQKSFTRSLDHNDRKFGPDVALVLPPSFTKEHGNKLEEYVIFRIKSSFKPWVVKVSNLEEPRSAEVKFTDGWEEFAADNRLKEGHSLVFVLKLPLPEFEVFIFQGTASFQTPARDWSNIDHCARIPAPIARSSSQKRRHEQQQETVRKTLDLPIGKKKAVQKVQMQEHLGDGSSELHILPSFQRRISASDIQRHLIEVPQSFVKAHGQQLMPRAHVELQGIHEESPVQIVRCYWYEQDENTLRLYFKAGWDEFQKDNGLHQGQELRFTLTAVSFFEVRKV